jgi:hypothetical protein
MPMTDMTLIASDSHGDSPIKDENFEFRRAAGGDTGFSRQLFHTASLAFSASHSDARVQ